MNPLLELGMMLPPQDSIIRRLLTRDMGEAMMEANKQFGVDPREIYSRNPLHIEPSIISLSHGSGNMQIAAFVAGSLYRNRGSEDVHEGEHVVVYTKLSTLMSIKMDGGDRIVDDVLQNAPWLVIFADYDGRRGSNQLLGALYSRRYGMAFVTGVLL